MNGPGEVVANTAYGVGLPTTSDLRCYIEEEVVILWLPFLSEFRLRSQNEHRQRVTRACHFLFHLYNMVLFYNIKWYIDFRNLEFLPPLAAIHANIADAIGGAPTNEDIVDIAIDASIAAAHAVG